MQDANVKKINAVREAAIQQQHPTNEDMLHLWLEGLWKF